MTTKNNESCQLCGKSFAKERGHVEMKTARGEWQKICFSCAIAELEITKALDEIKLEEEE